MAKDTKQQEKDLFAAMDVLDEGNPYATYLNQSTLSTVDTWIDTGSLILNALISGSMYKGVPCGRVTQFAAPSMCGKSYIAQKIAANAQKIGLKVVIFDSENAIDPEGSARLGLDGSSVKYIPANSIEKLRNDIFKFGQAITEKKLEGNYIIIIDSLANLQSEMELKRMDKESTSADMGTFAKAIKSLLKTCTSVSTLTRTTIVITNHVYDDPSAMYPTLEKNMAGGKSAVYLPSVTVQLARKPVKDDDGKTIDNTMVAGQKSFSGVILRALTVKNRFIRQFLEGEMYLSFSTGLDKYFGLLELLKGMKVVIANGATYTDWKGNKLGFYKSWRKDIDLWENTLLPELESRIYAEWCYGNGSEPDTEVIEDYDYEEELEDIVEYEEVPDEE